MPRIGLLSFASISTRLWRASERLSKPTAALLGSFCGLCGLFGRRHEAVVLDADVLDTRPRGAAPRARPRTRRGLVGQLDVEAIVAPLVLLARQLAPRPPARCRRRSWRPPLPSPRPPAAGWPRPRRRCRSPRPAWSVRPGRRPLASACSKPAASHAGSAAVYRLPRSRILSEPRRILSRRMHLERGRVARGLHHGAGVRVGIAVDAAR